MLHHVRTWSYNTHVANKHIYELWEFVDIGVAHDIAPSCYSWVILSGLQSVSLLVDAHTAKFETSEFLSIEPITPLTEKDRAGHSNFCDNSYNYQYNGEYREQYDQRHNYVNKPLHNPVLPYCERITIQAEVWHLAQHTQVHSVLYVIAYIRHTIEVHNVLYAIMHYFQYHLSIARGKTTIHLIDFVVFQVVNHLFGSP